MKRVDVTALSTKFGDLITADHKILTVENESRCGCRKTQIVQDDLTNWIQSYPMKNKRNTGNDVVFPKISSSVTEDIISTDNSKEFMQARQDLQWNHDTITPHRSETNGVAERAVRRL